MSASANGRDALLEIAGLTAGYGAQPVLHDVSLKVDRNEFVAVIGANTAGKSTLLRAISGLLPRCEGRIAFEGEDLTRLKAHEIAGLGIAHVPEGRHVFPEMTVEENLKMGAYSHANPAHAKCTSHLIAYNTASIEPPHSARVDFHGEEIQRSQFL